MTQGAQGVHPFWEQHDLYRVLGVSPTAEHSQMHLAYTRLVRAHHSDLTSGGDEGYLMLVNQVWETLGNPERRQQYDAWRAAQAAQRAADAQRWEDRRRARAARTAEAEARSRAEADPPDVAWTFSSHRRPGSAASFRWILDQLLDQPGDPYHQYVRVPGWCLATGFQVRSDLDGQWLGVDPWSAPTVPFAAGRPGPFGGPRGPLYLHISYQPPLPTRGADITLTLRRPGEAYWQPILFQHPATGDTLELDPQSLPGPYRLAGWGYGGVAGGGHGDLVVTLEYTTPIPSLRRLTWRRRKAALRRGATVAAMVLLVGAVAILALTALGR